MTTHYPSNESVSRDIYADRPTARPAPQEPAPLRDPAPAAMFPPPGSYPAPGTGTPAPKSPAVAAVLALCFGPFGMLYSTIVGSAVMIAVHIMVLSIVLALPSSLALLSVLAMLVPWPVGVAWAAWAAGEHNRRLTAPPHEDRPRA